MNWFVETRLAWIKESIEIFGFISREHIMRKFGVSVPQASKDLSMAQERWPALMTYDRSLKRYLHHAQPRKTKIRGEMK